MFFDTHAHLTSEELFGDLKGIIERAKEAGVGTMMNIATDALTLERALACPYKELVHAGATTPHDVDKEGEALFPLFEQAALSGKLKAIGETGLDDYYEHSSPATQRLFLERYLELAVRTSLPVIFHCRGAFEALFAITKPYSIQAVLHCFTGTFEEAQKALDRGWLISLSGILTFKKSEALRETVAKLPLGSLVLETDAPYLAPQSKRGKVCEPAFMVETAQTLALIKKVALDEVREVTTHNAQRIFQCTF